MSFMSCGKIMIYIGDCVKALTYRPCFGKINYNMFYFFENGGY